MFRFTIRDVLWLTVMVGLVAGWFIDHRQLSGQCEDLLFTAKHYSALATLVQRAGYKIAVDGSGQLWLIDRQKNEIGPATPEYP